MLSQEVGKAMVALPDAAEIVLVRVVGTNQGTGWQNTFHMQYSPATPAVAVADLNALCTSVLGAWATNFSPLCNTSQALASATAVDLTNRAAAQGSATNTSAGTRAGTAVTNQVACVVSWQINHRYRGGHPRTYLPAGVLADITSGHLWAAPAFTTAATNAAAAFRTALNAITAGTKTWQMVTLSYYSGGALLAVPTPYTIQGAKVHGRVDTQRNRLGKEVA